ncbi:MAG: hypothetical protein K1Y36_27100 [Blastocatellia bacterium]|nr:hypothetical protein [Blastocatellia bacterium]
MKDQKYGSLFEQIKAKDQKTAHALESMSKGKKGTAKTSPAQIPLVQSDSAKGQQPLNTFTQVPAKPTPRKVHAPKLTTIGELLEKALFTDSNKQQKDLTRADEPKLGSKPPFNPKGETTPAVLPKIDLKPPGNANPSVVKTPQLTPKGSIKVVPEATKPSVATKPAIPNLPATPTRPALGNPGIPLEKPVSLPKKEASFSSPPPPIQRINWYETGCQTQFSEKNTSEERFVIGFDFGTTCCKAIIRTPDRDNGRSMAVPFDFLNAAPFYLPTCLWVDHFGQTAIGIENSGGILFPDLKYTLIRNPKAVPEIFSQHGIRVSAEVAATCFLALALRLIRQNFLQTQNSNYGKLRIDWQFNLGIPARTYESSPLQTMFKCISLAAWKMSVSPLPIKTQQAQEFLIWAQSAGFNPGIHPENINVVPELAAEVTGYVKSPFSPSDVHVLVDIGGTTLDVTSFHIHEKQFEKIGALLTAEVEQKGALVLHHKRVSLIKQNLAKQYTQKFEDLSPLFPLPTLREYQVPEPIRNLLLDFDKRFQQGCEKVLMDTLVTLRDNRYATSPVWNQGLPVIFSGGGSFAPFYKKMVSNVESVARTQFCKKGFRVFPLPKPTNLIAPDLTDEGYQRLVVAFGLSFPVDDICPIEPIKNTPDIPRQKEKTSDWKSRFIGKDYV